MMVLKKILLIIYQYLFRLLGVFLSKDDKLIMFESFLGKQYSDNPRAIYEYLKENYPDYKLYWSAEQKSVHVFEKNDVKYAKRFSIKWLFLMNRSRFWVSNSRLPLWIPKPRGTIYIQTWHGTPLKRLALDMKEVHMPGTNTETYKRNFVKEVEKWDYLVSPNSYSTTIFERAFNFKDEIIETGYPRNDFLINNNKKDEIVRIKSQLNLPEDKNIILYAPTWRDHQYYETGRYKLNINLDLNLLKREISDEYVILFRSHYLIAEDLSFSKYKGFVYDVSEHEDIRELYLISDVLITDYSSVFFDYAILNRPIVFFVHDLAEYRDKLRGFYFDIESKAPGPLVKTTSDLIYKIKTLTSNDSYRYKLTDFRRDFCFLEDGGASERVVNLTIKKQ